ncbi:MAG: hypothetical protein Q9216_004531, partial [Gyalolechia sp. 2 TL-2023]
MLSLAPLVEIPPGYCFLPSCDAEPASIPTSSPTPIITNSLTTSTTTIFGPTFTAPAPVPLSKRSAAASIIPMLGSERMQAFPTDHPVQVGDGPICIVLCEWARVQQAGSGDLRPEAPLRPISDDATMMTSTMVS